MRISEQRLRQLIRETMEQKSAIDQIIDNAPVESILRKAPGDKQGAHVLVLNDGSEIMVVAGKKGGIMVFDPGTGTAYRGEKALKYLRSLW